MNKANWLHNKIEPILRAEGILNHYDISSLIQCVAEDALYDLWTEWRDDDDATFTSKSNKSFIIWLKGGIEA